MWLADAAWHEVNTTMIRNCWHKASILPEMSSYTATFSPSILISSLVNDQDDSVVEAESQLKKALDTLQATGVLQPLNQMAIDAPLNFLDELTMMDGLTDEEIFEAVMDVRKEDDSDEAGDKDIKDANNAVDIQSMQKEALSTVLTIQKYIQDINDPFACQLKGILGSFSCQTCLLKTQLMVPTLLTDFFSHK